MLPAVPIDPNPRLRIVAAVVVNAVLDGLLVARRLGCDDADGKADRRAGRRRPDIIATAAAAATPASTADGLTAAPFLANDAAAAAFLANDATAAGFLAKGAFLHFLLRREIARLRLLQGVLRNSAQRRRRARWGSRDKGNADQGNSANKWYTHGSTSFETLAELPTNQRVQLATAIN
jgi:hypothetical protein